MQLDLFAEPVAATPKPRAEIAHKISDPRPSTQKELKTYSKDGLSSPEKGADFSTRGRSGNPPFAPLEPWMIQTLRRISDGKEHDRPPLSWVRARRMQSMGLLTIYQFRHRWMGGLTITEKGLAALCPSQSASIPSQSEADLGSAVVTIAAELSLKARLKAASARLSEVAKEYGLNGPEYMAALGEMSQALREVRHG